MIRWSVLVPDLGGSGDSGELGEYVGFYCAPQGGTEAISEGERISEMCFDVIFRV